MCPNCQRNNPHATTVNNMIAWIRQQRIRFSMLRYEDYMHGRSVIRRNAHSWGSRLDLEQCISCWHSDLSDEMSYLVQAAAVAQGVSVGIYSSNYEWCQTNGPWCYWSSTIPSVVCQLGRRQELLRLWAFRWLDQTCHQAVCRQGRQ